MPARDDGFAAACARVRDALAAMGSGYPDRHIDCWAESEDVTLFGAWGPINPHDARVSTDRRGVASRPSPRRFPPADPRASAPARAAGGG